MLPRDPAEEGDALSPDPLWYHPDNPAHPPAWRWCWARHIVASGRRCSSRCEDTEVAEIVRYLRLAESRGSDPDRRHLARLYPGVEESLALYEAGDSMRRWEVEGRLLAGESFDVIGRKCNMTPEAAERYHN